jgi:hypothetical protein
MERAALDRGEGLLSKEIGGAADELSIALMIWAALAADHSLATIQ